jgi:hypothetical protein
MWILEVSQVITVRHRTRRLAPWSCHRINVCGQKTNNTKDNVADKIAEACREIDGGIPLKTSG